jgi:hypothetical protein
MTSDQDRSLKKFEDFRTELDEIDKSISYAARALGEGKREIALNVCQAEWHVRGLTHHCRNLVGYYEEIAKGVSERAGSGANVIVMYAPSVQKMWFEFYALVNLARIALDNLRNLLSPLFISKLNQLPKSISDYIKDTTDCPVYQRLAEDKVLDYLSDIRNCIVHYRTFATNDNTLVVEEGLEQSEVIENQEWFKPMARACFRRVGESGVSVNFYLPDVVFVRGPGDKRLAHFTYDEKYNVLSQSIEFVRLVASAVGQSFMLLLEPGKPTYCYKKPTRKK